MFAITRGPAKPISAPGSASVTSPRNAKLAATPAVVGSVITTMYSPPASSNFATAADVFAICASETMPSIIRAPPLHVTIKSGRPSFMARSAAAATFSPTTAPIDPMMKFGFITPMISGRPLMNPLPTTMASVSPVSCFVFSRRSRYEMRSVNSSGSLDSRSGRNSSNVPGSFNCARRVRASMR